MARKTEPECVSRYYAAVWPRKESYGRRKGRWEWAAEVKDRTNPDAWVIPPRFYGATSDVVVERARAFVRELLYVDAASFEVDLP